MNLKCLRIFSRKHIPQELHNMTLLYEKESLMSSWYPKSPLKVESLNQALQVFAKLHPEFVHFWQTELDVRYTGHWYNLLKNADSVCADIQVQYPFLPASLRPKVCRESMTLPPQTDYPRQMKLIPKWYVQWARLQPRKLQWERASRFFVRQFHKSWAKFIELVHASTPDGGLWGCPEHIAVHEPLGPEPPVAHPAKDGYTWAWEKTPILSL